MESFEEIKKQADAACQKGAYVEAAALYSEALAGTDGDICARAAAHSNRSLCFLRLGQANEAAAEAQQALRMRPRWAKAHLRAAQAAELCSDWASSAAAYQRCLELDPALEDDVAEPLKRARLKLARQQCSAVMAPPPGAAAAVYAAALCPVAHQIGQIATKPIAAACKDCAVRLWCPIAGTLLALLRGHTAAATAIAWSPDGSALASGSLDNTARLWRRSSNGGAVFEAAAVLEGHTGRVSAVLFGDGDLSHVLITVSTDLSVRVWEMPAGASPRCLHVLSGHSALVADAALCRCLLASASGDAQFRLWDCTKGAFIQSMDWDSGPVVLCGFLPAKPRGTAAPLLLTAHAQLARQEARVLLWDVFDRRDGWVDGRLAAPAWAIDGLVGRPTAWDACVDAEGATLLSVACADGVVRVWDVSEAPLPLFAFEVEGGGGGRGGVEVPPWQAAALQANAHPHCLVRFAPGGGLLAACGAAGVVSVHSVDIGTEVASLAVHSGKVRALMWLDSENLVSAGEDGSLRRWVVGTPASPSSLEKRS